MLYFGFGMAEYGIDSKVLQYTMRHNNIVVTKEVYSILRKNKESKKKYKNR